MTYTLWSHGELLGESALDYVRVYPRLRTGDLQVTPKGLIVLDRLSQTHADAYQIVRRLNREKSQGTVDTSDEETLFADLAAERDQHAALALELRAPNGAVIETEDISVLDAEYLLAIGFEADEEDELTMVDDAPGESLDPDDAAVVEEMLEDFEQDHPHWLQPAPDREPVRFQISVTLKDEWVIPA
jgi:hypothetical protein